MVRSQQSGLCSTMSLFKILCYMHKVECGEWAQGFNQENSKYKEINTRAFLIGERVTLILCSLENFLLISSTLSMEDISFFNGDSTSLCFKINYILIKTNFDIGYIVQLFDYWGFISAQGWEYAVRSNSNVTSLWDI